MAQVISSTPQVITPKGLGPGFWPLTIGMTVVNAAIGLAIGYGSLNFILPSASASNPASDSAVSIDWLFKFMLIFGAAITLYVHGYVIYFAIVFRRRAARRSTPSASRSTMLRSWSCGGPCC